MGRLPKSRDQAAWDAWFVQAACDAWFVQAATAIPALPGAYVLVVELAQAIIVAVGRRRWTLCAGRYLYCGSARGPGGLKARVARHMRRGKPVRWHVDRLTMRGIVRGAFVLPGGDECALAAALSHLPAPVPGFGSSDCRRCASHLFVWPDGTPLWRPSHSIAAPVDLP